MATCCFSDHVSHVAPRGSAEILLFTDGMPNINPPRGGCCLCGGKDSVCVFFGKSSRKKKHLKAIKSMKTTYFGRIYMDLPLVYYLTWGFYSHVWYRQSRKEMTPDPAVEWLRRRRGTCLSSGSKFNHCPKFPNGSVSKPCTPGEHQNSW